MLAAMFLLLLPAYVFAADVNVYAEGGYRGAPNNDLAIYIYADITNGNLCSYGLKLQYDKTKLSNPQAENNSEVWFMGTAGGTTYPYNGVQVNTSATPAEVVLIGGKLDVNNPSAGVAGTRILLGKVTFTRIDSGSPGTSPEIYFDINLALGKSAPYDNFVTVNGVVKDTNGVSFNTANIVRERGDANGDFQISASDFTQIRTWFFQGKYVVYGDCNADGSLSASDFTCVRTKFFNP
jgi:hypothetical protein